MHSEILGINALQRRKTFLPYINVINAHFISIPQDEILHMEGANHKSLAVSLHGSWWS